MCWSDRVVSDHTRTEEREGVTSGLVERFDFELKGRLQKVTNTDSAS